MDFAEETNYFTVSINPNLTCDSGNFMVFSFKTNYTSAQLWRRPLVDEYTNRLWVYLTVIIVIDCILLAIILLLTACVIAENVFNLSLGEKANEVQHYCGQQEPENSARASGARQTHGPPNGLWDTAGLVHGSDAWLLPGRFRLPKTRTGREPIWDGIFFRHAPSAGSSTRNAGKE